MRIDEKKKRWNEINEKKGKEWNEESMNEMDEHGIKCNGMG